MKMKKFMAVALSASMVASLAACGSKPAAPAATTEPSPIEKLKKEVESINIDLENNSEKSK
mgnify:CR=1 FL=1